MMWKKILIGFLVFVVAIVVLVFYATSGMTDSAENFLKEAGAKQYDKAYSMLSEDFKKATSKEEMIAFLKDAGLDSYKSASWGNRSFEGKRGELEGSITTASGGAVPLTIKFIKAADGNWQIYAISKPQAGTQIESSQKKQANTKEETSKRATQAAPAANAEPAKVPIEGKPADSKSYINLTKETIHDFAASINKKNMEAFRNTTASLFQDQFSVEQFNQAFKSFMDMGIDFTVLDTMQPIFDPKPAIDSDGVLLIKGYYETKPNRFYFDLRYVQESGEWKLVRINADIK